MTYEEYASAYAVKNDAELLRLQLQAKDLTLEASAALTSELSRRGINGPDSLKVFRDREQQRKERESTNPGSLFVAHFGIGRWYFGKEDRIVDPGTGIERFKTTIFIVLLFFPLVPTGTYLVEKKPGFLSKKIRVLQKLPLNWKQVLKIWGTAISALFLLFWVLRRM